MRDRRAKEIVETIDALNRQRDTAVARFEEAIKGYEKELETLKATADTVVQPDKPTKEPAKEPAKDTKSTTTATAAAGKAAAKSRKKDG